MAMNAADNASVAASRYELREQLKRILQSRHFVKAKKKSHFLEFLCEQAFAGTSESVNEYIIGVDIYKRDADFNPQDDAIVRVQAHELRRSLAAYYEDEGAKDPWRIDVPAGRYVPAFSRMSEAPPERAPLPALAPSPALVSSRLRWIAGAALCAAFTAGWLLKGTVAGASAAMAEPAAWFWQPFLPPAPPPLVVLPIHPLLRAAHGGDSPTTWRKGHVIPKEELSELRDTIHFHELPEFRFVPNTTDFTAVGESLGLLDLFELFRNAGQRVRVNAGRLVDYEAVKSGNTILLGGNQAWSGRIFVYSDGFEFRNGVISTKKPLAGERDVYKPEFDPVTNDLRRDYALVLMLPNEQRDRRVLLIYGIYTQGSQAAIEYVSNPERLAELRKALSLKSPDHKSLPKYFQVLLSTTVENYVPGKVSLVSTRAIPE